MLIVILGVKDVGLLFKIYLFPRWKVVTFFLYIVINNKKYFMDNISKEL